MAVSAPDFRAGMRQLAAAVNVITTVNDGVRSGMTATAVVSLTADPPHLGIAVNRSNASFAAIAASNIFVVNVLPHDHANLASRFAGMDGSRGDDRFSLGRWGQLATGAPVLLDSAAAFDCRVAQVVDFSSHVLFVGQVEAIHLAPTSTPLLFMDGTWASLVSASDHDLQAYEEIVNRIGDAMDAAIATGGNPARQLHDFSRSFAQISAGSIPVLREFFSSEKVAPASRLDEINRRKRDVESKLRGLLSRGMSSGDFDVPDAAVAADAIIGMMNSIHRWPESPDTLASDAIGDHFGSLVTAMVRSRVAP